MRRAGMVVLALLCVPVACSSDPGVRSQSAESVTATTDLPPTTITPDTTPPTSPPTSTDGNSVPTADGAGLGDRLFPELGFPGIDVQHYDVGLAYDPATDTIEASVGIDVSFTAAMERMALDAVGLDVHQVLVDHAATSFTAEDHELWIDLPTPVAAGDHARVEVDYTATPEASGSTAGIPNGWFNTPGGSYVLDEPDGARTWLPCNDHPSDKASYTFRITVPAGMVAVANGTLTSHTSDGGQDTWVWDMTQPMATYLIQLLTGDYQLIDSSGPHDLPLVSAVLKGDAVGAQQYVDLIPQQIEFFEGLFGPYPLDSYGIAITDSFGGLAMETQSRSLFSRADLAGELGWNEQMLLSHELAHQWFGDAVTPASWSDIWLNESFATYGQWLWLEHLGLGSVDRSATDALAAPAFHPVADPSVDDMFGSNSYEGGAAVLHALRRTIGDDVFFRLLRRWVSDNAGESRTTADFVALAEQVSGRDLKEFFDTWLYAVDKPSRLP